MICCISSYNSRFSQHLLENQCHTGTGNNSKEVLCTAKEGSHLKTVEIFCIHRESKNNNQLSDQYMIQPNTVFKAILLDSYDDHPQA
jgi:hypothetical protein